MPFKPPYKNWRCTCIYSPLLFQEICLWIMQDLARHQANYWQIMTRQLRYWDTSSIGVTKFLAILCLGCDPPSRVIGVIHRLSIKTDEQSQENWARYEYIHKTAIVEITAAKGDNLSKQARRHGRASHCCINYLLHGYHWSQQIWQVFLQETAYKSHVNFHVASDSLPG